MSLREFLITAGVACGMIWFVCWCNSPSKPIIVKIHHTHTIEIKDPYMLGRAFRG